MRCFSDGDNLADFNNAASKEIILKEGEVEIPEPVSNSPASKIECSKSNRNEENNIKESSQDSLYTSDQLDSLIQYLTKSKGVNLDEIDRDLVDNTIEFGQKEIAKRLNIPYRRYKSILNKVGIKTNAGRKNKKFKNGG
jgi:hypothetical protein